MLIEAEHFSEHGGWKLDTQFIGTMGSPYLLAHGLGKPVEDATTTLTFPSTGKFRVWVRTMDWVARWNAEGQPGKFQILLNGKPLSETFGTKNADWFWQDGGVVDIDTSEATLALHDLTGFDGRCDAIYFGAPEEAPPPEDNSILPQWRRKLLGLPERPEEEGPYDLVVVGGGYGGVCAAVSAARNGLKTALIQDRPVLGGNGSSEVRVAAQGEIKRGKYPHIGSIVEEITDRTRNTSPPETFEDEKRESVVRAEKNIDLFFNHFACAVEMRNDSIAAVVALDARTGKHRKFNAGLFADCTGHAVIGALAGADFEMTEKGHMGMSNLWSWHETDHEQVFPGTPWALNLDTNDFPYPEDGRGEWFWESGFDMHPTNDIEYIRDWNLRAVFGAWNALKNGEQAAKHARAELSWVAYIAGPRESRRLLGDIVLTKSDVLERREFPDAFVPCTWTIDLHYPNSRYNRKYPENSFIARSEHEARDLIKTPFILPYRCFYSRNIANLFMAGRNISVTHEALGTVRVMRTIGMMGEVIGKAAKVCMENECLPRAVYEKHLGRLIEPAT